MIIPHIDPIIFQVGPISIRWYAISYIIGITSGIFYIRFLAKYQRLDLGKNFIDDFLFASVLGIVIGGRLGYALIYDFESTINNPLSVLQIWLGGMSFHGGFLGFLIATFIYSKTKRIDYWNLLDLAACAAPIGIFFGRIANFINRELIGRETNSDWGIIFPEIDMSLRHPSQIYEALSEGLLLFLLMNLLFFKYKLYKKRMILSGYFCLLYSSFRFISEFFREPDLQIGYVFYQFTMGQTISALMFGFGAYLIYTSKQKI
jgi:phosphatidylglycerol---prolipoprotein diacylglyceryl transferase